jgi:anti-sigma B factor antagonist
MMQVVLKRPTITIIHPHGSLNAANAWEFERELTTALTPDHISTLVVNLAAVESLDSAGLMALLSTLKLANKLGKKLQLCSVSSSIRIIFELTQLDGVLEILPSEPEVTVA